MRLHNLKDAAGLMPGWVLAAVLNIAFLALYVVTNKVYALKPNAIVAAITNTAIVLSLLLAVFIVIAEVLKSEVGSIASAVSQGLGRGLNLSWATAAISAITYIGFVPATGFISENLSACAIGLGAGIMVVTGYFVAVPSRNQTEKDNDGSALTGTSVGIPKDFQQTNPQRPAFQASMADLTRLLTHQAGRAIGYSGANIVFDDTFSLELDVHARVARVYSNSSIINTSGFMYWRLHMLLMGPAAEKVILGNSSEVAIDDFTSFDDLASRYLTLNNDRTFNATPISQHEAALKASRIAQLRKSIFDRCLAECQANRRVLLDLIKLMRTRSVLTYGDIRSYLERVTVAEGFPVAQFDDPDILSKALLEYHEVDEVVLEGAYSSAKSSSDDAADKAKSGDFDQDEETKPEYSSPLSGPFSKRPANEKTFMNA
tara:strand:+ start:35321 stop:36610 length:1290 start_codon:yes stop_codon:yes gene_type:complete